MPSRKYKTTPNIGRELNRAAPRKRRDTTNTKPPKRVSRGVITRIQPSRRCRKGPSFRFPYFSKLPLELRENIYGKLLAAPNNEAIDAARAWDDFPKIDHAIFRVNRQIGREAAHYFYSTNTFCFLEHCDEWDEEGAKDISKHRLYIWLDEIGQANRLSTRRLQLRMRYERRNSYYTNLLAHVAAQIPNLKRLALVMETHRCLTPLPDDVSEDDFDVDGSMDPDPWQPNFVIPLNNKNIRAIRKGLQSLRLNTVLVVAPRSEASFVQSLPLLLGCQVLAIDPRHAGRSVYGHEEEVCENFFNLKRWFQSPGGLYNQQIRREMSFSSQLVDQYFEGIPNGDIIPEIKDNKSNLDLVATGKGEKLRNTDVEEYRR